MSSNEDVNELFGVSDDEQSQLDDISVSSLKPMLSPVQSAINDNQQENAVETTGTGQEIDPVLARYLDACRQGDLATVKEMLENGIIKIDHDFDENEKVTGLHWASVNNRLSVVKYLVSQGANVNGKAGNLHATPLHWAASYGYVYIVDYLLDHGADPTLTDDQGFNLLHLAVNSSNIMLILYVLFFVVSKKKLDINCLDPNGRTPLLWAAYQGDSLTVNALLKFGANVKISDAGGFTPLHWGTVKGQPHVLKYLIQDGADFFQKTNDQKDCFTIAKEMNTVYSLDNALRHCGFNDRGYPIKKFFKSNLHAKTVTFFTPFVLLGVVFALFSYIHPIFALIVSMLFALAVNKALKKLVLPSYSSNGVQVVSLLKSPFLTGLFSGSSFWLLFVWLFNVSPVTFWSHLGTSIILLASLVSLGYLVIKLFHSDPGCIPPETDHEKIRETIRELLTLGKFDTKNFCIETWVHKPLRSRYSYLSNTLVSRFDHYCPWVYNDIGLKNHKQFVFFVISLVIGIISFVSLAFEYFDELEDMGSDEASCFLLGDDELCAGYTYSPFTFLILFWSIFQFIWVVFLIFVQFFQISKGVTSYEFSKLVKENRRSHAHSPSFNESFNTTPEEFSNNGTNNGTRDHSAGSNEIVRSSKSCLGICFAVIGLDQWVMVFKEALGISNETGRLRNGTCSGSFIPTNYGWKTNSKDFWLTSDTTAPMWQRIFYSPVTSKALLNDIEVDYYTLYELPLKRSANEQQLSV